MPAIIAAGVTVLAEEIATGRLSAEEATQASLQAIKQWEDLNAVIAVEAEAAMERARQLDRFAHSGRLLGPLHGVPMAHKDMFYREGKVCECGSKIRRGFVPDHTSPLITRLEAAGAITVGRLHMSEFALGPTGHNVHLGRCGNPWHPDAISGGSSSGAGAAVGAGIVPGALGSDTGGSVRLPAAFCGAVGLKTTQYLLDGGGSMPLSEGLDTIGPIARNSRDIARLMTVLNPGTTDYEGVLTRGVSGISIGVPIQHFTEDLAPEIERALLHAREVFVALGVKVIDVDVAGANELGELSGLVWAAEAANAHQHWLRSRPQDYGEQVRARLTQGLAVPAVAYLRARQLRSVLLDRFLAGPLSQCDLLLTPITPMQVPMASEVDVAAGSNMRQVIADLSAFTRGISFLGLPAITTPMGVDLRGLPIGMQLIGRPNQEATLIHCSHSYETATDWLTRPLPRPPNTNRRSQ